MARTRIARLAFNRGIVSRLGLARADIQRLAFSAETSINWLPRVLGSMSPRPGMRYLARTRADLPTRSIPFVFATNDVARVELTNLSMRVFVDDAVIARTAVSTAVTNDSFTVNLANWTDNDEAGGVSAFVAGGYMGLTGNGTAAAIRDQSVTVGPADINVEHALHIIVKRGPVSLRVGTTTGLDDYISETELDTGNHSLAFTPTADFSIRFFSRVKRQVLVDSCAIAAAGDMVIPTPWTTADLDLIAADEHSTSGDIIFVACDGFQQRKIERRGTRSWSLARYQADDGPFAVQNVGPITLTPSALSGNVTLTASASLFKSTHAPSTYNDGALFSLTSNGQAVSASITAQNQFTNAILVEGVDNDRIFTVVVDEDAAGAATFTLQRSLESDTGPWNDVMQWTADVTTPFDDGLDNQTAWYRLGVKTGDYVNGTHSVSLNYSFGSITGIARLTSVTTSLSAAAEVIKDFGAITATDEWAQGAWSDVKGWPTSGSFYEGRLGWAGRNGVWLSVSDGFYSFDGTVEGDSAPIARTIGSGPVDVINWMLPLQRLILGSEGAEHSCRSSSQDEILTVTNFNIKPASSKGSNFVQALKIDSVGLFVGKGGSRVYELDIDANGVDYASTDVTALAPDVCEPEIVRAAVQRLPDTRVHFVLSDGTAAVLVYDKVEKVMCWLKLSSVGASGTIEDVCVLPAGTGSTEDSVYYQTKRTINGATVRFSEKWALESECRPDEDGVLQICKLADSFVTYSQAANSTISGLSHLEGASVVVWDNGVCLRDASGDIATFTVTGGAITVTNDGVAYSATVGMVGLSYDATWESGKFVELATIGSIADRQRLTGIRLILADVHAKGLRYGRNVNESAMDDLPTIGQDGAPVDPDELRPSYVTSELTFPGDYSLDARLCLLARAPRPCTVLAALGTVDHHD